MSNPLTPEEQQAITDAQTKLSQELFDALKRDVENQQKDK